MYKYRFSIFTATYNRSNLLYDRVYQCLLSQTFKDFEWIIIDDGSIDNTEEICRKIILEKKINIKYVKKQNGGKHTAWRVALPLFEGMYELGADDDDTFPENTLEIFDKLWKELEMLPVEEYESFWEIRARCLDERGNLVGAKLPQYKFDSDFNELHYKYHYYDIGRYGEMQGCRKVSVLQQDIASVPSGFLFENKASNFPEGIRWSRVARKYKTRFVDEIVRVYIKEYSSLSGSEKTKAKSYNRLILYLYRLNEQRDLIFKYKFQWYFRHLAIILYSVIDLKVGFRQLSLKWYDYAIMLLAYIPVWMLHCLFKNKY